MKPLPKVFLAWYLIFAYLGSIFILSSLSDPFLLREVEKYSPDFILHAVQYAILGFLLVRALGLSFERLPAWSLFGLTVLLGSLYGLSDEWHQSFVPGRVSSARDFFADVAGVTLGSAAWLTTMMKGPDA